VAPDNSVCPAFLIFQIQCLPLRDSGSKPFCKLNCKLNHSHAQLGCQMKSLIDLFVERSNQQLMLWEERKLNRRGFRVDSVNINVARCHSTKSHLWSYLLSAGGLNFDFCSSAFLFLKWPARKCKCMLCVIFRWTLGAWKRVRGGKAMLMWQVRDLHVFKLYLLCSVTIYTTDISAIAGFM